MYALSFTTKTDLFQKKNYKTLVVTNVLYTNNYSTHQNKSKQELFHFIATIILHDF